jgi:hypothetical protein
MHLANRGFHGNELLMVGEDCRVQPGNAAVAWAAEAEEDDEEETHI